MIWFIVSVLLILICTLSLHLGSILIWVFSAVVLLWKPLLGLFQDIFPTLGLVLDKCPILVDIFTTVINDLVSIFKTLGLVLDKFTILVDIFTTVINDLVPIFKTLRDFLAPIFTIKTSNNPPKESPSYFDRLFLIRIPLISLLVLVSLPYLASGILSQYLENIFIMESEQQLTMAIVITCLTAISIGSMIKTILLLRCQWPRLYKVTFLLIILVLVILISFPTWYLLWQLNSDLKVNPLGWNFNRAFWTGIIGSLIWLFIIFAVESYFSPQPYSTKQDNSKQFDSKQFKNLKGIRILINIGEILAGFIAYGTIIFLNYPSENEQSHISHLRNSINTSWFGKNWDPPTLIYALFIISIMTILIGGLTYYWDLFFDEWENDRKSSENFEEKTIWQKIFYEFESSRFSVILFLIVFSASSYGAFGVDHYFKLHSSDQQISNYQEELKQAVGNRLCPEDFKKYGKCKKPQSLVVVAASGGGIQASGWTAQVLAGLQDKVGEDFTKSIALISSVSGGSVGTMFYLDNLNEDGVLTDFDKVKVVDKATEDWLGSVGWGLAFPDLLRFIGLWKPLTRFNKNGLFLDRGYALEKSWENTLSDQNITLDDWHDKILQGKIPIPIFNATLVENGRRFLISPIKLIGNDMVNYINVIEKQGEEIGNENSQQIREAKALDLKTLFNCGTPEEPKQCDLNITTAARLSASFPYVSPLPRNYMDYGDNTQRDPLNNIFKDPDNEDYIEQNYHIADGGYFDNGGTFTAIERLNKFLEMTDEKNKKNIFNIKKIALIDIDAFPEEKLKRQQQGMFGYVITSLGAIDTLNTVRNATQIDRNLQSVQLLKDAWDDNGIEIEKFTISFPSTIKKKCYDPPLSRRLTEVQKNNLNKVCETDPTDPPLSRRLTEVQKDNLNDAWETDPTDPPLSWRLTEVQKNNLNDAWETDCTIKQTVQQIKAFWYPDIKSLSEDCPSTSEQT